MLIICFRRLYVGNIPNDTVSTHLESFLNVALRQVGGCFGPGNAVVSILSMLF
jgi:hypothetical protein